MGLSFRRNDNVYYVFYKWCVNMNERRFTIATFPVLKRPGKIFTSMAEWENLVCGDCGEKMVLERENDYDSVKFCCNCGRRDLLIKKLKHEETE